jgi:serine/threonine protein kinase
VRDFELAPHFRSEALSWKTRWTTIANLRSGAQAAAKKAHDLEGTVAFLKILNKQTDPERRTRMYQEIVSIQRLDISGVPKLIESNAHHFGDSKYHLYVAMEFIDGTTLTDLVPRNRVSADAAVGIALDLCRILRHAHDAHVYHRDIKPDNIMLVELDSGVRTHLVDFGIAHLGQSDAEFKTETEQTVGNTFLALPEFRGGFSDKSDPRSDITLCVGILFFMLTKTNPIVLMDSHRQLPHQRPIEKAILGALGLASERLRLLFDRGFRYDIGGRFQTLDELEGALNRLLHPVRADDVTLTVTLDQIRERLDAASEEEKRDRMAVLEATLIDATGVLQEIVSALQGRVVRARSGYSVTSNHARSTDGFQLSTDARKTFAATFDVIAEGNETVLRLKGSGVPRITLRTPFLTPFNNEGKAQIRQFLLRGLDLVTKPDEVAELAEDAKARHSFAAKTAENMVGAMTDAVSRYIAGDGRELMVVDTPAKPVKAQMFPTTALAQSMVLARLSNHNKYARFSCLARVEIPNHREETETEADQQIMITLTDGRTGSGPSSSIEGSRYFFAPLRPSQRQIDNMVKAAIAEIDPSASEEVTHESLYDREARESREIAQGQAIASGEQEEFLGKAVESVAERLRAEISAGMRAALGEPEVRPIAGRGASRQFLIRAESAQERARATITADLTGQGPEYVDAESAHYTLELSICVRPGPGRPTGDMQTIRVKDDYYGTGRPGISAGKVETAILSELARVRRMGK